MVLDLELHAEFCDHSVVEIGTIICDNPFGDAIPINKIVLNESGHTILGNRGKWSCFHPLCKVNNGDEDEAMSVRGSRLNLSNHINSPYCE